MKEKKVAGSRRITQKYFCSIEVAVDCITGKWKPATMYFLMEGPLRYTELCKLMPQASKKVLTEQLRELESDGLITRRILSDEVPKGMEYSVTEAARELIPVLELIRDWGIKQAHRQNIALEIIVKA